MKARKPNLKEEILHVRLLTIDELLKNVAGRITFIRTKAGFFYEGLSEALLNAEMQQLQDVVLMLNRMRKKALKE